MYKDVTYASKKKVCTRPDNKPTPGKLLPKRENMARPMLQHHTNNFTIKGTMTIQQSVTEKGLKRLQQTVLPPIPMGSLKTQKDFSRTQLAVLPPISRNPQKTHLKFSPCQNIVPPPIHTQQKTPQQPAIQQQGNMQKSKTKKKKVKKGFEPKEKPKVEERPIVERTALTPETVLRESRPYLTDHELEEVKEYKEVWYLGTEAHKTRYSNFTETEDIKSTNSGYDTEEGYYVVIINDHLAYRFEVLEVIGTGYSGQVLKCLDHKTMELVAIKVIRNKDGFHLLGKAEVKILDALRKTDENNTANIVHMKENFYFRNHLCITFELFEKDLYKALKETNRRGFDEKEIRKYAIDVLKCLQMLKKKRVIHGDIKPENILLYKKGSVKHAAVSDFGGSCFMKHRDQPLIYTLYYMSPEMLLGKTCSTATDMWSLGCMLPELFRGRLLFRGRDNVDQFSCIMKVLGVFPTELLVRAPKSKKFFDLDGVPLNIKDIKLHSRTLAKQLNSKDAYFLDFIERCLKYDPTKRITPEEALQHPWIHKKDETKAVKLAEKTRQDATVLTSSIKPVLLKKEKMPPLHLPPIKKKVKAKTGGKLRGI
ncbi:dual specificity tyrosine-phosphorylation-regulated kinase 4-like [Thunnus albacares]|uniref:dual specificity tyrosine-phosphorylation-regulated kinase 4-like n=1 Tax=Thunnus albacares TaxID=8236 RepID=UPI001CF6D3BC|nr:dual specificity tyrosine-phosphorylation-regulated kinase 4-like [Thunnus albacares]